MAKGIAHREWRIDRDEYRDELGRIDEQQFRYAVQQEMSLAEHIGERLGVAIVAAPVRTRASETGTHFTVAWVFRTATVPSASGAQPDAPEVDEPLVEEPADFDALAEVEQPA